MSKFGNVAKLKIDAFQTAEFEFWGIEGMEGAKLIVSPATSANPAFYNPFATAQNELARRTRGKVTGTVLFKTLKLARPLFASYVIRGWSGIVDSAGEAVSFSTVDCIDFLTALPDSLFNEVFAFCQDEGNFRVTSTPLLDNNLGEEDEIEEEADGDYSKN